MKIKKELLLKDNVHNFAISPSPMASPCVKQFKKLIKINI